MNLHMQSDPFNPKMEECLRLRKCWVWFLVLGVALIATGTVAVCWATLASFITVIVFGYLLLASGIVQIVNTFLVRSWRGATLNLLGGVLHLVLGGFMIDDPVRTLKVLTFMLVVAFLIAGLVRSLFALIERFTGWFWVLLNGIITFALGVLIWRGWPDNDYWVIGLFVGIDLIFNGWSWVMLALIVRGSAPASLAAAPEAQKGVSVGMS